MKTWGFACFVIAIYIFCYFSCKVGVLSSSHLFVPKALSYSWFLPAAHNRLAARVPAFFNWQRLLLVPFINRTLVCGMQFFVVL